MRTRKTIIALKLRVGKRAHEWATMGKFLASFVVAMALIGALQVVLCKCDKKDARVAGCLAPRLFQKGAK